MGARLVKLFATYSYNMDGRSSTDGQTGDLPTASSSTTSSADLEEESSSGSHKGVEASKADAAAEDKRGWSSREESSAGSSSSASKDGSKKKRHAAKGGSGGSGGSCSRKDFFGKRNKKWPMRKSKDASDVEPPPTGSLSCVCTMYRRTNSDHEAPSSSSSSIVLVHNDGPRIFTSSIVPNNPNNHRHHHTNNSIIDLSRFNPADYPIDDEDERMRQERAREMAEGVDITALLGSVSMKDDSYPAHSQVDFVHYLVPDLKQITNCSFYWGKIDRYEAEKLLEGKPEGTFLLRDSAQEEYLFSVSFRRYNRSLHARIEQWNNQFSFDSHDPSVYSSPTVTGLIEHYKDPSCCMFFEPMLTTPLHRNFTFGLQHLCRATIAGTLKYDSINSLDLPKSLKMYLKEYHYKQRVRSRRLE